jgi:hypothetical protein
MLWRTLGIGDTGERDLLVSFWCETANMTLLTAQQANWFQSKPLHVGEILRVPDEFRTEN